jgi:hypothetical protein
MYNPFWVADARVDVRSLWVSGNHACVLRVEEGRTRPGVALSETSRHVHPLTSPVTAKSASSQGGALALDGCEHTHLKTHLKDMKMEFIHD